MQSTSTFVDHFPCDPSTPHFGAHEKIDSELRNCGSLWPNAPMGVLFPACCAATDAERNAWMPAVLERVEWHCSERTGAQWLPQLTGMLRLLLRKDTRLDESTFFRLVKFGPRLHLNSGTAHLHDLVPVVAETLSKGRIPLTPQLGEALDALVNHLVRIHDHSPETYDLAFRLFREGWSNVPWIAAGELNSREWKALLDLADHRWQSSGALPAKPAARIVAAITKIGDTEVAAFIQRSVEAMQGCQPTPMSGAGMTMLRQMLVWMQAKPELSVDDALYGLCGIRWQPAVTELGLMKEWLGTLLQTLALRDPQRAFACTERLANNPDTNTFREVLGLYEQFMHEMLRDVPSQQTEGVDGFPITNEMHRILDSFERACTPRPFTPGDAAIQSTRMRPTEHFQLALRQSEHNFPAMLRAMNERVHWLAKQEPPPDANRHRVAPWLYWCCDFGQLYCNILDRKPTLNAADLAALCEVDALGWLGIAPTGPVFNACEAFISKHGFDPELTAAIQQWQKTVFGGGTAMALRKHIGWLLWFDTAAPINEKACWSAVIRKDLRSMPAETRGPWIALLRNVSFGIADKPTKKWLKPAEKLLKNIDANDFRARLRAWFAPFKAGRELKITIAGRDILAALLWYSQLAKDPEVDEAVRWFATAKWKAKTDRDRTARLLPIWIHTMLERAPELALDAIHEYQKTGQLELMGTSIELYQELCSRYDREPQIAAPPPPAPLDQQAMRAKMMQKAMHSVLGDTAQVNGDSLSVLNAATGERYEVGLRDGRIVRVSDGKTVRMEIDWSRPPFSPFKSMLDSQDLMNPFGRNYFRAMLCAQVLSGALPVDVPIVLDEPSS